MKTRMESSTLMIALFSGLAGILISTVNVDAQSANQTGANQTGANQTGANQTQGGNCDPSYPTVCIESPPPQKNCSNVSDRNFEVIGSDPHGFDGDNDGIGCES